MNIATLQLSIKNAQANAAIDATDAKLVALGATGEATSARMLGSTDGLTKAQQFLASQSAATQAAVSRLSGATVVNAASTRTAEEATARYIMVLRGAETAAYRENIARTATNLDNVATSAGRSIGGLGRLTYSFGALDARMLGTSSIAGRMGAVFGNLGVGVGATLGIMAGIAVVSGLWRLFFDDVSEGAKRAAAAVKKLTDEIQREKDALGSLTVAAAGANLAAAKAALDAAKTKAAGRGAGPGDPSGMFGAALSAADTSANAAAVRQAQAVYDRAVQDAAHKQTDALATLIKGHALTHQERQNAITLLRKDQAEEARLLGKSDDASMARRVALVDQIRTLNDALNPKGHAKKPLFLDTITSGSAAVRQSVEMSVRWYDKEVQAADKAIAARAAFLGKASLKSVKPELLANGSPAMKAFDQAVSAARDTQDRITTRNAINAAHGKGPINEGPGTVMDTLRKSAVAAGAAVIDQLQRMGASGKVLQIVLEAINKEWKDIGANAPKAKKSSLTDSITSGLRTAGDAANLFSGPRAGQYANALNTGANAIDNVKAARAAGPISLANIIPDAQAVLSIVSLGKQIFSLGGVSHDAARAIQEASASVRNSIAILNASVNHDALGGLLAQAQAAKDALKSQINSELSGKKREKERNAALASADAAYAVQQQQIRDKYAVTVQDFFTSTAAATDRAKGLNYQASLLDLQVQQRDAMQALVDQGILLANGGGTAQQKAAYIAEQGLLAAQRTALATESLTQLANAPTGFFAERYFGQFSTPAAFPGISPPSTSTGAAGGGSTFNAPINININGANKDPAAIAKETVAEIRKLGNQYGGMGTTIADTMELMS